MTETDDDNKPRYYPIIYGAGDEGAPYPRLGGVTLDGVFYDDSQPRDVRLRIRCVRLCGVDLYPDTWVCQTTSRFDPDLRDVVFTPITPGECVPAERWRRWLYFLIGQPYSVLAWHLRWRWQ